MDIFNQLELEQKFSASLIQAFEKKFGDRFFKALEKLDQQKQLVSKYMFFPSNYTIWVIQGQKDKYIIYPDIFCILDNYRCCFHLSAAKDFAIAGKAPPDQVSSLRSSYLPGRFPNHEASGSYSGFGQFGRSN